MRLLSILGTVLALLPHLILATPYGNLEDLYGSYDDNNEVAEEEEAIMKAPSFVSLPLDVVVNEGETIRLPCIVSRLQGFVLMWKKNGNIISVGDQILGNADSRYNLEQKENGNNLLISLAELSDQGDFVCQVSAFQPTQIQHSVKIRVRPVLRTVPGQEVTVVEGGEVRLQCDLLAGQPPPRIFWRKAGGRLPTGELEVETDTIVLERVNRHQAGTYQCVTRDGSGLQPVTKDVEVFVEYSPVIEQEQTHIKTGGGEEIHITCAVEAHPPPSVDWYRDGSLVSVNSPGVVMNQAGSRYNLIILVADKNYYGEYSCQAANKLGVARKSLHVSAYADEAQINPIPLKATPWLLQIEWTAKSETPITIFRVQFMAIDAADWSEVGVSSSQLSSGQWYGRASLEQLRPSSQYMVQVSSLNQEGYSKFSPVTFFTTPIEENFQKEAISNKKVSSSTGQATASVLTSLLVVAVCSFMY